MTDRYNFVDWKTLDSFIFPYVMRADSKNYYRRNGDMYLCLICDCLITDEPISLQRHVDGNRHSCAIDEHGFYILPLDENNFYCICCDLVVADYRSIYCHIRGRNHTSNLSTSIARCLGRPSDWNCPKDRFVSPFVIGESDEKFYCMICDRTIMTRNNLSIHSSRVDHAQAVKNNRQHLTPLENDYYYCKPCDLVVPRCTNILAHLSGRMHRNKTSSPIHWNSFQDFVYPFVLRVDENEFYCAICDLSIVSLVSLEAHVNVESHTRFLKSSLVHIFPLENNLYRCATCACIISNCKKIKSHILGIRHRETLKRYERDVEQKSLSKLSKAIEWISLKYCVEPFVLRQNTNEFYCMLCNWLVSGIEAFETHKKSRSHCVAIEQQGILITPLKNNLYHCNCCDCIIPNYTHINKHITARRHKHLMKFNELKNEEMREAIMGEVEKIADRSKSTNAAENLGNFDDDESNFPIDCKSFVDDDADSHCKRAEDTRESFEHAESSQCSSSSKNKNLDTESSMIPETIGASMVIYVDTMFSLMSKELAILFEQLKLMEIREIEDVVNDAIAAGQNNFLQKSYSIRSALRRVEDLVLMMQLLSDNASGEKTDANAGGRFENPLTVTESRLKIKILDLLRHEINPAIGSGATIVTGMRQTFAESTDSGNDDSSPLASTSLSILIENSDVKNHAGKTYAENVANLLDFQEDIYDTREITRRALLGLNLRYYLNSRTDYCLICRKIVSSEPDMCLRHFYDHEHVKYLEIMEKEHRESELIPDNLSELELAREYIEILSNDETRCLACRSEMCNDFHALKRHIDEPDHREMRKKVRSRGEKNTELVVSEMRCDWYRVQKYACLLCAKKYDYEIDFVQHLLDNVEHSRNLERIRSNEKKMMYEFCAICALLSCSCPDEPTNHRDSFTHKWFVKNGPYLMTEFPKSAVNLLTALIDDEDIAIVDAMEEIEQNCRESIVRACDKGTGYDWDLSFESEPPVEDVKFIKFFNKICPSCEKMLSFLEKWLSECNLSGPKRISTLALYWYLILYLQTISILPSISSLTTMKTFCYGLADREDLPNLEQKSFCIKQHLVGFFGMYANFDYRYDVACPLLGKVVEKRAFVDDVYCLPEQMRSYASYMKNTKYPQPFRVDSVMCLQDPFDLQNNLTKSVSKLDLSCFRIFCFKSFELLCSLEM